jgi:catechol 2,3-dioxygenase-like lactoylglutathione lyase family enzyme
MVFASPLSRGDDSHVPPLHQAAVSRTQLPLDGSTVGTVSERSAQGVIEVIVPDIASTIRFYEALGFHLERRSGKFVSLNRDDVRLYLVEDPDAPSSERWINLRIIVRNVDDVWASAQRAKLSVAIPIGDRLYGLRDFTVQDPAGLSVRFAQLIDPK